MHRTIPIILAVATINLTNLVFATETQPTFSSDVATIIHRKCTICHHRGSSAPFSLVTFDDVRQRAATIEAVLDSKYMPPWKPVDHGLAFSNARNLSADEDRIIREWIDAECPEGDRSKIPSPPEFTDGWTLGTPDLVVTMNGEFEIPADGPDVYRSFVFPLQLPEDKWVKAVELRPRAKSSVHHAIFFLDTTGNARQQDGADGRAGISGMGFLADFGGDGSSNTPLSGTSLLDRFRRGVTKPVADDNESPRVLNALARGLGGYVPGSVPNLLPGDLAMLLPSGSDVVMQTHFHPSGKAETEQAELALYFADQPPSKLLIPIQVPAMFGFGANIRIPAGEKNYRISDSITLPVDTQAIGVAGHAHYVCREMKLTAELPSGDTLVLLEIDDWDLDWQDQYHFATPIDLPAGTVLQSEIIYDNSDDNPENPNYPSQEIRWGRGSNDEMGSVTLLSVAAHKRDEASLQAAVRNHVIGTLVNHKASEMAQLLLQLDDNDDGKLQRTEAPPRLSNTIFGFIDLDLDGGLDAAELERLLQLRDRFWTFGK